MSHAAFQCQYVSSFATCPLPAHIERLYRFLLHWIFVKTCQIPFQVFGSARAHDEAVARFLL